MPSQHQKKKHTLIHTKRDMTEREKEIKHFSHEHPLIFKESEEIPFHCDACGLRVLSSPCYMCSVQGCIFYLHEPCTRLPEKLSHHMMFYDTHDLHLRAKPPQDQSCRCSKCKQSCKNFTYHCDDCDEFDLHPLCAHPLEIRIKHISHKEHTLVAICKESMLLCDVCGREHRGFFFQCHQCSFLIHQDCASLPSILRVERHRHPLSLVYSASLLTSDFFGFDCIICEQGTSRWFGFYICLPCNIVAHVYCAVSRMRNSGKILHLPAVDDTFSSLIMHTKLEENENENATRLESNGDTMLEKYHPPHSLITNNENMHESVCNACIGHITPPYYSCSQSACNFLLHKFCADLPLVTNNLFNEPGHLVFPRYDEFFSLFFCMNCLRWGNGFGYSYEWMGTYHLDCVLAPRVIEHDSHKQHPLIRADRMRLDRTVSCCSEENPYQYDLYSCTQCVFSIHVRCALLPKTVTHKFDEHPLILTMASSPQDIDDLCEFCEEDINPSYWFYRCIECDHSFHVKCIPSTGKYSRIKFGGTVVLPCHGDHPMTLVRMLSVSSQTCGLCQGNIKGFEDGMALRCTECDFWLHFRCGAESIGATIPEPFAGWRYLS